MLKKIKNTIKEYGLISRGDKILIGLSGGADSVCLTHILYSLKDELGIEIMTAHLNHMIRGSEADNDASFAAEYSKSLGIKCITAAVNIPAMAKQKGISEETAGRCARYEFFYKTLEEYEFNKIATAHNLNDSAETIAMNFMRGSALSGLCGIPCKRGNIIRPLLDVSRTEIEVYCEKNGLKYVTDSTNSEDNYTRNKIRHTFIPMIESEFNPDFISTVTRNAGIIKAEEDYISAVANEKYCDIVHNNSVDVNLLLECHTAIARRIVRRMIGECIGTNDISSEFVDKILILAGKNNSGAYINLPAGAEARIEYGRLIIAIPEETPAYEYALELDKEVYIKEAGMTLYAERVTKRENDGAQYFSGIDTNNLIVRSRRNGDYFYPSGMSGKKKLKNYFIDEKITRHKRDKTPVLVSGGDIVYIVGHRRDRRFNFTGSGVRIKIIE